MSPFVTFPAMFGVCAMAPADRGTTLGAAGARPEQANGDPSVGAPTPPEEALADPQNDRQREIEARNFALLQAGGTLEACGREVYACRLAIQRQAPAADARGPEEELLALLKRHADLARAVPEIFLDELRVLNRTVLPAPSDGVPAAAAREPTHEERVAQELKDAQTVKARLAEIRTILGAEILSRQEALTRELKGLKDMQDRGRVLRRRRPRIEALEECVSNIDRILRAAKVTTPAAFFLNAQGAIDAAQEFLQELRQSAAPKAAGGEAAKSAGAAPAARPGRRGR